MNRVKTLMRKQILLCNCYFDKPHVYEKVKLTGVRVESFEQHLSYCCVSFNNFVSRKRVL